ncbi:uncharacterized protein LOC133178095 [Saccostrea echinata]|uniref:uncharacterized protein LOC133178095 n=1 Tax=Saccostrea echinata TaxID=191078 RepID=UPI002A7F4F74|nr:uncharacterized protein LOC133178095 [Saccostrea echinata]
MDYALEFSQQYWKQQAHLEARKNRERRYQQGRGPCNIFILDTSSNLGEEGFIKMKETFCTIMDEYAKHPEIDENVAVLICGKITTFKHYYSNQYNRLKLCIDDVEYGGPCPLTAAFILSEGGICEGAGYSKMTGHFHIHPRLILISSGRPTDFTAMNDFKNMAAHSPAKVRDHLYQMARNIGRFHPIFCIPVGKRPDMKIAAILTFSNTFDILDRGTVMQLMSQAMPAREFTEMDKDDIFEICSLKSVFISMDEIQAENEKNEEQNLFQFMDPSMPPLGSRVKRGPDWMWKNQDQRGPGTVVAHSDDAGWLIVHWDIGTSASYRYGTTTAEKDKYDIVVCLEPRILHNELIAVGCLVRRGPDWNFGDQDGGTGSIGAVYKVKPDGVVDVSWSNGSKGNYKYGSEGEFDLTLCDPFSPEAQIYLKEQRGRAASKLSKSLQYIYCDATAEDCDGTANRKMAQNHEVAKTVLVLKTPKGRYFKNDSIDDDIHSDIEEDCSAVETLSLNCDHWLWKDKDGIWNHYPKKINDKIMKCYKRSPNSTVVILFKEHL